MTTQEIINQLKKIDAKISDNEVEAWEPQCENTVTCVILEDFNNAGDGDDDDIIVYNHWRKDLKAFIANLQKTIA